MNAQRVVNAAMVVVAVALIVRGVMAGVIPPTLWLVAGVLLLTYAVVRWRYL